MLLNNAVMQWGSKRQATVETSTYGTKMIATYVALDAIIEMRYKLRMLGVPIKGPSLMLSDNMSVVLNTTIPSSPLKKKHLSCVHTIGYVRLLLQALLNMPISLLQGILQIFSLSPCPACHLRTLWTLICSGNQNLGTKHILKWTIIANCLKLWRKRKQRKDNPHILD